MSCVRVWVHLRWRDSVIYPEMEKKKRKRIDRVVCFPAVQCASSACFASAEVTSTDCRAAHCHSGVGIRRVPRVGTQRRIVRAEPGEKKKRCRRRGGKCAGRCLKWRSSIRVATPSSPQPLPRPLFLTATLAPAPCCAPQTSCLTLNTQ